MIRLSDIEEIQFTDPATICLVSTSRIDESAMAPLVDDEDELALLEKIESLNLRIPDGLNPAELPTAASVPTRGFISTVPFGLMRSPPGVARWFAGRPVPARIVATAARGRKAPPGWSQSRPVTARMLQSIQMRVCSQAFR